MLLCTSIASEHVLDEAEWCGLWESSVSLLVDTGQKDNEKQEKIHFQGHGHVTYFLQPSTTSKPSIQLWICQWINPLMSLKPSCLFTFQTPIS